ncbi:MAG: hypothetical protein FD153_307 [Rhodospirillaceae bacterium]|nr:MAG: hypothetical protein FD153_307 [Rhodospirillaceae bacterium]
MRRAERGGVSRWLGVSERVFMRIGRALFVSFMRRGEVSLKTPKGRP